MKLSIWLNINQQYFNLNLKDMSGVKVRTSRDVYIDEHVDFNLKKPVNIVPGEKNGDAVEFSQYKDVSDKLNSMVIDIDIGDPVTLFENSIV